MKLPQLRTTIEKNGKGKIKTNVLGSEVARYVCGVSLFLTFIAIQLADRLTADRSDQGKLRAQWKHHKIPEISICRRRRFQNLQKDAAESENRLKT